MSLSIVADNFHLVCFCRNVLLFLWELSVHNFCLSQLRKTEICALDALMFSTDVLCHIQTVSVRNWVILSHAHTVVWECCKDDRQSQWGMAKFDPQPTLNPWTDRHQIWNTWLRRRYLPPRKISVQSAYGLGFGVYFTYVKYIHFENMKKPSNVYFFFSQFFRKSTDELVGPIFTVNTS